MAEMTLPDGRILKNVHEESQCIGQHCVIHNPSAHLMRSWPIYWYNPLQLFLRQCAHGHMHPDPDVVEFLIRVNQRWKLAHHRDSCDGCCVDSLTIEGEIVTKELTKE